MTEPEVITQIERAFSDEPGPASFRYPEKGNWYKREGKEIQEALLNLDPGDVTYDDLYPDPGDRLISFCSDSGIKWLIPGIIRIIFEHPQGESVLIDLFEELEKRRVENEMNFSKEQRECLLGVWEAVYLTEKFNWDAESQSSPFFGFLNKDDFN